MIPGDRTEAAMRLKLDLHDIFNKGRDIDRALADIMDEAERTGTSICASKLR